MDYKASVNNKNEIVGFGYVLQSEIERRHKGHFFDKSSMKFFNSRIAQYGYRKITSTENEIIYHNLVFFVTSEKNDYKSPRLYTIRCLSLTTGKITTVGEFQGYKTSATANRHAQKIATESI